MAEKTRRMTEKTAVTKEIAERFEFLLSQSGGIRDVEAAADIGRLFFYGEALEREDPPMVIGPGKSPVDPRLEEKAATRKAQKIIGVKLFKKWLDDTYGPDIKDSNGLVIGKGQNIKFNERGNGHWRKAW